MRDNEVRRSRTKRRVREHKVPHTDTLPFLLFLFSKNNSARALFICLLWNMLCSLLSAPSSCYLVMLVFNPVFVLLVIMRAGAWSISHRSSVFGALTLFHFFNIELAASFSSYLTNWALRSSNACHNICYIICYARQWRFWSPTLTRAAFIQFGRHLFYSHQMRKAGTVVAL